jgi:hypothetical protein
LPQPSPATKNVMRCSLKPRPGTIFHENLYHTRHICLRQASAAATTIGLGTYLGLAGALLAMIVLFSFLQRATSCPTNTFSTLANQIPDLMVLAVGMTFHI